MFINIQKVCSPPNYKPFCKKIKPVAAASCPLRLTERVRQAGRQAGRQVVENSVAT